MLLLDVCLSDIPASSRRTGKNGKIYAHIIVDEMKQPDNYGNTHTVYMSQSKEEKATRVQKVYIGKAKEMTFSKASVGGWPKKDESDGLPF